MAESGAKIVRAKLRKLLRRVDMDSATQRSIQKELEEDLGVPLDDYKQLIKEEIDAFLLEEEGEGEEGGGVDPEEEPPAKKKQKAESGAAVTAGGGPPGCLIKLSDKRFVTLSQWKGKWYVDVREYYLKDGALAPGGKGLNMAPEQWRVLTDNLEVLSSALAQKDDSQHVELGNNRRVGPSNYGGRSNMDLREFYQPADGGAAKPGKKGISLTPEQWEALQQGAAAVTEQLLKKLGGAWPAGAAPKQQKQAAAPSAAPEGAGPSSPAAAGGGNSGGGGSGDSAGGAVDLGSSRRADVSLYQGKVFVNIREYYTDASGELKPGRKGISLQPDQFSQLASGAARLGEALRGKDTACEVELSAKRKATVRCYSGKYYVDIREFYSNKDTGELAPGKKGISLTAEQWAKLEGGLPQLQVALEAAG